MNRHEDFCCDRNCKMCWPDKEEAPVFPPAPGGYQWSDDYSKEEIEKLKENLAPVIDSREMRDIREEKELADALMQEREDAAAAADLIRASTLMQEAREYAKAVSRQTVNIIVTTSPPKHDKFIVKVDKDDETLYCVETGIEECYLGHVAEDYILPLRNLLEGLGFDVMERYI